jgi:hypothetical protein
MKVSLRDFSHVQNDKKRKGVSIKDYKVKFSILDSQLIFFNERREMRNV